ncbi:hypothetical protein J6590_022665 [Homalodisca vitripennis]|nr:hypothetical protein J6590_022665 [Homalodisca vitripennis]
MDTEESNCNRKVPNLRLATLLGPGRTSGYKTGRAQIRTTPRELGLERSRGHSCPAQSAEGGAISSARVCRHVRAQPLRGASARSPQTQLPVVVMADVNNNKLCPK